MAVVQYSAIVTQLRGKLGGSVFNKARNVFTLQKKQQQPKGSRGFQSEVRNFFSRYQRSWKALTNAQRTNWQTTATNNPTRDRFGNLTVLSGYNQFVKASMLAEYANAPLPTSPYTSAAPANSLFPTTVADSAFTQTSSGMVRYTGQLSYVLSSYVSPWALIMDISLPVSAGVMSYHGRWVNVAGTIAVNPGELTISVVLGDKYPLPISGQKIIYRVRLLHVTSGTVVQEYSEELGF